MGFGNLGETHVDQRKEGELCSGSCHAEQVLQILNSYRQSGTFTDVVLQVGGSEFPCHRATLSASSLYFRTMFHSQLLESRQSLVDIHEENVESVFRAADLLGVSVLSKACVRFLEKQVDHSNCLGIMNFASSYFIRPLTEKCQKLVFEDFVKVYKHEEFLTLSKEQMVELLSSEELLVEREEVLVEAVLKWVHHDPSGRKAALRDLLELVHLPLVDPAFFLSTVETDVLVQDCKDCRPLLLEARKYQVFGNEENSATTRPRRSMGRVEMIVVIGGCDKNSYAKLSFTEKLNTHTKEWLPSASIPGYSKSEFAACAFQNDIYLSGGQLNSSDVWRHISQLDTWVRVAPLNKGRWRHKMAALRGKLYAVGGFNGMERLLSVESYSPFDNHWQPVAPLLLPVSSAAVAACGGKLYVIGGAVQCYDPVEDKWSYMAPCPFTQRCINAAAFHDTIYVVGGLMDKMYSFSPQKNTWSECVFVLPNQESCGLTACDGKIYILGGRNEYGIGTDRIYVFDPKTSALEEEPPMTRCVSYHGCVTVVQRQTPKP
ncbi:KLH35 protein, partial [Amia calva]|nr:KLH35 protein [Amia calva]